MPHQTDHGQTLVAWFLAPTVPQDLRDFLAARLPDYMIPSAFTALEAYPQTPNGKIDRKRLPQPNLSGAKEKTAARDDLELRMLQVWREVLAVDDIGVDDNFFNLGGHSLLAVTLMSGVTRTFGRELPLTALFQAPTPAQLTAMLRDDQTQHDILIPLKQGETQPLFIVHPVGGNVFSYTTLAKHLPENQTLIGIQSPLLHESRTPADLPALAKRYVEEIRTLQPEGPYHLSGWSVGGVIAYEMAHQLQAMGETVAQLTLIDSYVPTEPRDDLDDTEALNAFFMDLAGIHGRGGLTGTALRKAITQTKGDLNERLTALLNQAQSAGLLPPGMDPAQMARLYRTFAFNLRAFHAYQPKPVSIPTLLLVAEEQPAETGAKKAVKGLLRRLKGREKNRTQAWEALLSDQLTVRPVEGDHYSILLEPTVAATVATWLKEE